MYSIGNLILNGTLVIATLWIVNRYLRTFYNSWCLDFVCSFSNASADK